MYVVDKEKRKRMKTIKYDKFDFAPNAADPKYCP